MTATATKKKSDDAGAVKAAPAASVFPKVGDIVLYAHRGFGLLSSTSVKIPMIVTKAYEGSTTIDGVVFSADFQFTPNGYGCKPITQVRKGMDEGEWQPLR